ncbi:flagellar protein FliT [Hydrogenovibrio crunogenus]|uniref:Flagellar protein FliT n=1 Tax=Hydrogenovibrio crunogenus TaxID=39765 RepID=A0A4P7P0I9_9GAMM|nr:flagellar protein FliT [Hydrogenovibrio crunogenus]
MSVEQTKLNLLAHSKNMLNAAESRQWQELTELDHLWHPMLENAVEEYGEALSGIVEQILEDNEIIAKYLQEAQQETASEMQQDTHIAASIKEYLK